MIKLQILKRSTPIHGRVGCDQVPLQGFVDAGVSETD